ncbi:MAG: tRNA (adenosine(37)-N6)-dimethylallyltransferase MiaA [Desulfobacteraceae bacterium 4572_35.1]|nr:MAG: tRNA (adenosine(37)-N6)-dimethylallyltransferase MiaA [Desulfobacteraceae bacterium 4572_35.1]
MTTFNNTSHKSIPINLFVILGATASGKTSLAVNAARLLQAEIISADSRQVYRGMDIGSGKDLEEYAEISYHMIDIADPGEQFDLFTFQQRFVPIFHAINNRGNLPLMCGGSGMYLDSVLRNEQLVNAPPDPQLRAKLEPLTTSELQSYLLELEPSQHNRTNLDERERTIRAIEIAKARANHPPTELITGLKPLIFGLRWPRTVLRTRITQRLHERLQQGMIEEVEQLHLQGVSWQQLEFYGLEYRFIAQYLQQQLNRNDMIQKLGSAIHQFAKRQDTWFRRMEKHGCHINWLEGGNDPLAQMMTIIAKYSSK